MTGSNCNKEMNKQIHEDRNGQTLKPLPSITINSCEEERKKDGEKSTFGTTMEVEGELQNAKEAIRWATDYLLKATAQPGTVYVQVGNANRDHACWERPEDMDTPRSVFKQQIESKEEIGAQYQIVIGAIVNKTKSRSGLYMMGKDRNDNLLKVWAEGMEHANEVAQLEAEIISASLIQASLSGWNEVERTKIEKTVALLYVHPKQTNAPQPPSLVIV
ncbi:hypothetical protein ACH5RR_015087 [Cinchona calisaya]|uniref:cellulase n=1 Tax=Cinchona calisaya TaxID=153742 RepID=A0ABD2ZSK2_9GENT